MKSEGKAKVQVTPRAPKSPATDYTQPQLQKIATKLLVDAPKYVPQATESSAVLLRAKLDTVLRLPHRAIATIDAGCSVALPAGYKANFAVGGRYSRRGLFVISGKCDYPKNVEVTVINLGREIVQLEDGDDFVEMTLEVTYWFDWICDG